MLYIALLLLATAAGAQASDAGRGAPQAALRHADDKLMPIAVERYAAGEGLEPIWAMAIIQDPRGYLWIGTQGVGLRRFDGVGYARYVDTGVDLTGRIFRALAVDRRGQLWAGAFDGGLNRYDPVDDRFVPIALEGEARPRIWTLIVLGDGTLLAGTPSGELLRFGDDGTLIGRHGPEQGLPKAQVNALLERAPGIIDVGGGAGWLSFDLGTGKVLARHAAFGDIYAMVADARGGLILGGGAGLTRLDPQTLAYERIALPVDADGPTPIRALAHDRRGRLWVGHSGRGLYILDNGRWRSLVHEPERIDSLPSGNIWSLYEDRQGLLWIGTGGGLARYSSAQDEGLTILRTRDATSSGLSARAIAFAPDGRLAVADGPEIRVLLRSLSSQSRLQLPPATRAQALTYASDGQRLVAALSSGELVAFNGTTPEPTVERLADGLSPLIRQVIEIDPTQLAVLAWDQGAKLIKLGANEAAEVRSWPDSARRHVQMAQTTNGRLRAWGVGGLSEWDPATGVARDIPVIDDPQAPLAGAAELADGRWAVLVPGRGLMLESAPNSERFSGSRCVLDPTETLQGLLADLPRERIWVIGSGVAYRCNLVSGHLTRFDRQRGLPNAHLVPHYFAVAVDGRLAMGIDEGVLLMDSSYLEDLGPPSAVVQLRAVVVDGVAQRPVQELRIAPPYRQVSFGLDVLDFRVREQPAMQARLLGFDSDWRTASDRLLSYTNLAAGTYSLQVRAIDPSGVIGEWRQLTSLTLTPHWTETIAARSAAVVVALALIALVFWGLMVELRRQRQRSEELEQARRLTEAWNVELSREVAVQTQSLAQTVQDLEFNQIQMHASRQHALEAGRTQVRFLAQMSHDLKTPLTGILGYLDLARTPELASADRVHYLDLVAQSSRDLLRTIDDILDQARSSASRTLNADEAFSVRTELDRLLELLAHLAHQRGHELSLHVPADVHDVWRGDAGRLRQILTNLLGNAIKFIDRGQIQVVVSAAADGLAFAVIDDGPGIPIAALAADDHGYASRLRSDQPGHGLGLSISRELAAQLGGSLSIECPPSGGTTACLRLPLRPVVRAVRQPLAGIALAVGGRPIVAAALVERLRWLGAQADLVFDPTTDDGRARVDVLDLATAETLPAGAFGLALLLVTSVDRQRLDELQQKLGAPVLSALARDEAMMSALLRSAGAPHGLVLLGHADEPVLGQWRRSLTGLGAQCLLASDGLELLSIARSNPIGLVLVDQDLPLFDGQRVIGLMQSNPALYGSPQCVLALAPGTEVGKGLGFRCLHKPISDKQLAALLATLKSPAAPKLADLSVD